MIVKITPLTNFATLNITSLKTSAYLKGKHKNTISILPRDKTTVLNQKLVKPTILIKRLGLKNDNNPFILAKKKIGSPRFSIKLSLKITPPTMEIGKKRMMLYQKIERNNLFSNRVALVNRFHFKV